MNVNYAPQPGFIVDGLYTCQQERTDELNERMFSRIHSTTVCDQTTTPPRIHEILGIPYNGM
jgi:hypothetical protein